MKYTFVCDPDECDALLEFTARDGFDFPNGVVKITCPCGRQMQYVSATIAPVTVPTNEKVQMETATPNYLDTKIAELEEIISRQNSALTTHQNCDYWKAENGRIGRQLIELVNDSYDNESDSAEILQGICEIIDYNPKKTINFSGTITFSGSIDLDRSEVEDFDLHYFLQDEMSLDINHGDTVIDSYEVESVHEEY